MALTQVTPGKYDYGQYASPTQIKYNPAGQQAIGKAVSSAIQGATALATKDSEERKKINNDQLNILANTVSPETIAQNSKELSKWVKESSDLKYKYAKGRISQEEFLEKDAAFRLQLDDLGFLSGLSEQSNIGDIDADRIKDNESMRNYVFQKQIQNQAIPMFFDQKKNAWSLILIHDDINNPDELISETVTVAEIKANPGKYFNIETKINEQDKEVQDLFKSLAGDFDDNFGKKYMTNVENGYKTLDKETALKDYANSYQVDVIYKSKAGKDLAEDVFGLSYGKETEQQVKEEIARRIVDRAKQVGVLAPEPEKPAAPEKPTVREKELQPVIDFTKNNPITEEQWKKVSFNGNDQSLINMEKIVEDYGFTVRTTKKDVQGETEIGFVLKDNYSGKTINVYKADTAKEVYDRISKIRGTFDPYQPFIIPPKQ